MNMTAKWVSTAVIALAFAAATTYVRGDYERTDEPGGRTPASGFTERVRPSPFASNTSVEELKADQEELDRMLADIDVQITTLTLRISELRGDRESAG
jgi:hypothetical protein